MVHSVAIYLAGAIQKGHEVNPYEWTGEHVALLKRELTGFEVTFLNPALRTDDLSDQRSVFGRDMVQVFCADVVFVDARERRGLGVGAEMMWAKLNGIPVVTWAPVDTHYRQSETSLLGVAVKDWIHPFVEGLSDQIVDDLAQGAAWIRSLMEKPGQQIKDVRFIEEAMEYYKISQLPVDEPMQQLMVSSRQLGRRLEKLKVSLDRRFISIAS